MKRLAIVITMGTTALSAWAQPQQPATQKSGVAAALADEQRLMSELSRRQLDALLEYSFRKNNIPESERKLYLTISSLRQLSEAGGNLTRRQQQELVGSVARGIEQVLAITNDPRRQMELAGLMVRAGTVRPLNLLEYWGENPRMQMQLRPVAQAIDRIYQKAIDTAQARADELAKQFTNPNDVRVKEWEELAQLVANARFSSAFNKYALAMSLDRADPERAKIAAAGIEILKEFEDPQYEVEAMARSGEAKLGLAIGKPDSISAAKEQLKKVLADPKANWTAKWEAVYFNAVADLVAREPAAARKSMDQVKAWLAQNPPPSDALKRSVPPAITLLEYRILSVEAETNPASAAAANQRAIAVLQSLMASRPDLAPIINEQLIARLPDNPDVKSLTPMLLRAILSRGDEELRRPEGQPPDKKILAQAVAAAGEMIVRAGKEGITRDDAETATLLMGLMQADLGRDAEAAQTLLGYVETYRRDPRRLEIAYDNAAALVAKLRREQPDSQASADAYLRFLQIATGEPFNRKEFAYEYARLLLERNISAMQGALSDAARQQALENARRAAALFAQVNDDARVLNARYNEMLAVNQVVDLLPADSPEVQESIRRVQALADRIRSLLDQRISSAADDAARKRLQWYRVRTSLLAADLAKHDRSGQREASLRKAISLLADFEKDVQGMPDAQSLLGEALFIRINALLSLGRSDEALENLGRFLETRSGDDGIRIVYEMLESLNKEFLQAQQDRNESRMAELAGHRAKVSGYLVDRVARSSNPDLRKLLPKYRMFEAGALQQAAILEKDDAKRRAYLNDALRIFQEALKTSPDDKGIILNIALVKWDLGDYAAAQPVLVQFLSEGWLGKPRIVTSGPEGQRATDNNQYWDGMYRLLKANVALAQARASGYDPAELLDQTRLKLKQLYIQWGEPGGPRWAPKFEELRQQILPDWIPPAFSSAPTTLPAN